MQKKRLGNEYHTTLVCIDDYEGRILKGRLLNPGLCDPIPFYGAVQFLREMEKLLDEMKFPESFTQMRTFRSNGFMQPEEDCDSVEATGKIASFNLRILFRQNATWQGSIIWLEGRQEESFRSVLELMILIDSALTHENE